MLRVVTLLLALAYQPAWAQEVHAPACLYVYPQGAPANNDLVVRSIYILSSNEDTKFADRVAYLATAKTIAGTKRRVEGRPGPGPRRHSGAI
jgi:hypothetical protein